MTRKDYIELAAAFRRSRPLEMGAPEKRNDAAAQWLRDVGSIARSLAAENPKFDQGRFIDACMGEK